MIITGEQLRVSFALLIDMDLLSETYNKKGTLKAPNNA